MTSLPSATNKVLEKCPPLAEVCKANNLFEYYKPVLDVTFNKDTFPAAQILLDIIVSEVDVSYDAETATGVKAQLEKNFALETAGHLSLPRSLDRAAKQTPPNENVNTLTTQNVVLSAALNAKAGHAYNISAHTGKILLNNVNSPAYLQVDADTHIRLVGNKFNGAPVQECPPLTVQAVSEASKGMPVNECSKKHVEVLASNVAKHPKHFDRQIATTHAELYDAVLPPEIKQVTINFDRVATKFLINRLRDTTSLVHNLFVNPELKEILSDGFTMATGWQKDETPFDSIVEKKGVRDFKKNGYEGPLTPEAIVAALEKGDIMPKYGLLMFTVMAEAGLMVMGGMAQAVYAPQIRDVAVTALDKMGQNEKSDALREIPYDKIILTPVWGVQEDDPLQPINYSVLLKNGFRINASHMEEIMNIPGEQSVVAATAVLHSFLYNGPLSDEEASEVRQSLQETQLMKLGNA